MRFRECVEICNRLTVCANIVKLRVFAHNAARTSVLTGRGTKYLDTKSLGVHFERENRLARCLRWCLAMLIAPTGINPPGNDLRRILLPGLAIIRKYVHKASA